jgi:hypothetical protein
VTADKMFRGSNKPAQLAFCYTVLISDLGVSVSSVQRHSLFFPHIPLLDTTCFGITDHLQVCKLFFLLL